MGVGDQQGRGRGFGSQQGSRQPGTQQTQGPGYSGFGGRSAGRGGFGRGGNQYQPPRSEGQGPPGPRQVIEQGRYSQQQTHQQLQSQPEPHSRNSQQVDPQGPSIYARSTQQPASESKGNGEVAAGARLLLQSQSSGFNSYGIAGSLQRPRPPNVSVPLQAQVAGSSGQHPSAPTSSSASLQAASAPKGWGSGQALHAIKQAPSTVQSSHASKPGPKAPPPQQLASQSKAAPPPAVMSTLGKVQHKPGAHAAGALPGMTSTGGSQQGGQSLAASPLPRPAPEQSHPIPAPVASETAPTSSSQPETLAASSSNAPAPESAMHRLSSSASQPVEQQTQTSSQGVTSSTGGVSQQGVSKAVAEPASAPAASTADLGQTASGIAAASAASIAASPSAPCPPAPTWGGSGKTLAERLAASTAAADTEPRDASTQAAQRAGRGTGPSGSGKSQPGTRPGAAGSGGGASASGRRPDRSSGGGSTASSTAQQHQPQQQRGHSISSNPDSARHAAGLTMLAPAASSEAATGAVASGANIPAPAGGPGSSDEALAALPVPASHSRETAQTQQVREASASAPAPSAVAVAQAESAFDAFDMPISVRQVPAAEKASQPAAPAASMNQASVSESAEAQPSSVSGASAVPVQAAAGILLDADTADKPEGSAPGSHSATPVHESLPSAQAVSSSAAGVQAEPTTQVPGLASEVCTPAGSGAAGADFNPPSGGASSIPAASTPPSSEPVSWAARAAKAKLTAGTAPTQQRAAGTKAGQPSTAPGHVGHAALAAGRGGGRTQGHARVGGARPGQTGSINTTGHGRVQAPVSGFEAAPSPTALHAPAPGQAVEQALTATPQAATSVPGATLEQKAQASTTAPAPIQGAKLSAAAAATVALPAAASAPVELCPPQAAAFVAGGSTPSATAAAPGLHSAAAQAQEPAVKAASEDEWTSVIVHKRKGGKQAGPQAPAAFAAAAVTQQRHGQAQGQARQTPQRLADTLAQSQGQGPPKPATASSTLPLVTAAAAAAAAAVTQEKVAEVKVQQLAEPVAAASTAAEAKPAAAQPAIVAEAASQPELATAQTIPSPAAPPAVEASAAVLLSTADERAAAAGAVPAPPAPAPAATVAAAEAASGSEDDDLAPAGSNPWEALNSIQTAAPNGRADAGPALAVAAVPSVGTIASTGDLSRHAALTALRALCSQQQRKQLLNGTARLQPRGLNNTGNTCFINSTLQALLACGPFCNLLARLQEATALLSASSSPTLLALAQFAGEFEVSKPHAAAGSTGVQGSSPMATSSIGGDDDEDLAGWAHVSQSRYKKGKRSSVSPLPAAPSPVPSQQPGGLQVLQLGGKPLTPSMLHPVIRKLYPRLAASTTQSGQKLNMAQVLALKSGAAPEQEQQDAQEFFQYLMDMAHEEVMVLAKQHDLLESKAGQAAGSSGGAAEDDNDSWAQVGKKNKAAVTRQAGVSGDDTGAGPSSLSPIKAIFYGAMKSVIKYSSAKPSATIEPFCMLHLDIHADAVQTLEAALGHSFSSEPISDYKPEGSSETVSATKCVHLYRLPEVLVLHLKRFQYMSQYASKLNKPITYDTTLRLKKPLIADDCPDVVGGVAEYKLIATVSHHGRNITAGHYTADVLQPDGRWLHFNDAAADMASEAQVLHGKPYLLFYHRVHS